MADDGADVADGFDDVARARFAFGANHGGAFGDAAEGFAQISRAAHERDFEAVLPDVVLVVGGCEHFAFVNVIDFERFEHLRFGEMADANFGHHRNRDRVHDFADDARSGHAGHAAIFANIGRHALERHHGAGSGLLGDARLLGVGDVHNHAAFQHFGQAYFHAPQIIVHQIHVFLLF